ncbi:MAG: DUF2793 domain-containing protein [Sphingomonadaceae bacterium]|nr:DUF2793 domain-containing protein [Sphingomonadaceae bacterium]
MTEQSARFALPHIMAGQAQKEVWHNEALTLIDAALHPVAETIGVNTPPGAPGLGECHIVGSAPTGAWTGKAAKLAAWTAGGWRFIAPITGMRVWLAAGNVYARWDGTAWQQGVIAASAVHVGGVQVVGARQGAIASLVGTNDMRDAINAMLAALRAHGLIAT